MQCGFFVELMAGIEPANLILTKDALYRLSYISKPCHRLTQKLTQTVTQTRLKWDETG